MAPATMHADQGTACAKRVAKDRTASAPHSQPQPPSTGCVTSRPRSGRYARSPVHCRRDAGRDGAANQCAAPPFHTPAIVGRCGENRECQAVLRQAARRTAPTQQRAESGAERDGGAATSAHSPAFREHLRSRTAACAAYVWKDRSSVAPGKDTTASLHLKKDCSRSGKNCLRRTTYGAVGNKPVNQSDCHAGKLASIFRRCRLEQKFLFYEEVKPRTAQAARTIGMKRDKCWRWKGAAIQPGPHRALKEVHPYQKLRRKPGDSLCRPDSRQIEQQIGRNANHRQQPLRPRQMRPRCQRECAKAVNFRRTDSHPGIHRRQNLRRASRKSADIERQPIPQDFRPAFCRIGSMGN